jgi:Xaa-Pro aminopeptidase
MSSRGNPERLVYTPGVKELLERCNRAAAAWKLKDEIVLFGAGEPIQIPGRADQTYPFRSHSEYFYFTDRDRPGGVLAFDPAEGWTDFVPRATKEDAVWSGAAPEEGVALAGFEAWMQRRKGRRVACLGSPLPAVSSDEKFTGELRQILNRLRWPKDEAELDRMRRAASATRAGYAAIDPLIKPGSTEREVQIYLEEAFFLGGGTATAYDTIVGGGPNSAVLHFSPTPRAFEAGELALIDAGAEFRGYACDVTRTYPVSGRFTAEQADIYAIVLATEKAAIERCHPGVEYKDVHMGAARDITQGLIDMGLLRGDRDSLIAQGAHALFFPHGIGHMVGLGVRDAGGYMPGRQHSDAPGLRYLRIDLPLKPHYVVTIEPGIYFIPALLRDPEQRARYGAAVNWDRAEALLNFGGIRIEDNVHILEAGHEVLTAEIPKLIPPGQEN